jgi:hypothetical protein
VDALSFWMMPNGDGRANTGSKNYLELTMATDHLTLPSFIEPPPRIPVAAKIGGSVQAVTRRRSGYQFIPDTDHHCARTAWIERALTRRR